MSTDGETMARERAYGGVGGIHLPIEVSRESPERREIARTNVVVLRVKAMARAIAGFGPVRI